MAINHLHSSSDVRHRHAGHNDNIHSEIHIMHDNATSEIS
jgi:hypothetical protein